MTDPRIEEAIATGKVPQHITAEYLGRSKDSEGVGWIVFITLLVNVVVISRLSSRAWVVKRLGLDDGLALISLIIFIPFAIVCTEMIRLGSGRPFTFRSLILPDKQFDMTQTLDTISQILYATALMTCRASGLAFYHRICALYNEFLIIIKFIFCIIFLGYLAQMSLIIFHCLPVTTLWGPSPKKDFRCISWLEVQTVTATISFLCDLLVFGIPLAMLRVLKSMDRKRKIQLSCIFFPGIMGTDDYFIYAFLSLLVVEVSEIGISLIAISLPGLRPLLYKFVLRKSPEGANSPPPHRSSSFATPPVSKAPRLSVQSVDKAGPGFQVRTITSVVSPRSPVNKEGATQAGISVTSEFKVEELEAGKKAC
ncbi:hypothetical protein L249_2045 [Ophiocordyceps polyrhachis-furcata BCC 54312]|uniref:Rhodopsin domain-containing protein n=1 Tax=Ophiocordyceps polyrhachis-furcata BCC 54312 TaxID=1330021 RepID=A0A367LRL3_9HYPO|nr:hypothetical protein L249_2045 [Ophiocordyceps polyrhachis-furcata BCC 54312]